MEKKDIIDSFMVELLDQNKIAFENLDDYETIWKILQQSHGEDLIKSGITMRDFIKEMQCF